MCDRYSLSRGVNSEELAATKLVSVCMQPASRPPRARIASVTFSDDIIHFQLKAKTLACTNFVPQTPRFNEGHYGEKPPQFQHRNPCPALRWSGCGFFAAS